MKPKNQSYRLPVQSLAQPRIRPMQIVKHDKSHLVELFGGSQWRAWPHDLAATLKWQPTAEIEVVEIRDGLRDLALS